MPDINKLNGYDIRDDRVEGILDDLTSVYQSLTDLNRTKQDTITGGASSIASVNLETNRALISNASGKVAASPVSNTELGYVKGVTSAIQTQLNAKQDNVTGGASSIVANNLTANRALVSNASGKVAVSSVSNTELGYVKGVTSAIQTQLNNIDTKIDNSINSLSNATLKKEVRNLGTNYTMTASDFDGFGFFKVSTFIPASSPQLSKGADIGDWWLFKTYNGSYNFAQFIAVSPRTTNIYYGGFSGGNFTGWKKIMIAEEKVYSNVRYASKTIAAGAKGSYSLKDLGFTASDIPSGYEVVGYERIFASSDKLALSGFFVTGNINGTNTISYINPTNASVTSNIGACLILEKKI